MVDGMKWLTMVIVRSLLLWLALPLGVVTWPVALVVDRDTPLTGYLGLVDQNLTHFLQVLLVINPKVGVARLADAKGLRAPWLDLY